MFGAPIGGVDVRCKEKGEDARKLDAQMRGEPRHGGQAARAIKSVEKLADQSAACDGGAVNGDRSVITTITKGERTLQDLFNLRGKRGAGMIAMQGPAPPEQVRHTRLMSRVREMPIRGPAIVNEHAVIVRAEDGRRLRKASSRLNGIDGRISTRKSPQPLQTAIDFPARFIGDHHRASTNPGAQRLITGTGLMCRAMQGVDESTRCDRQAEAVVKERRDFRERHAKLFVENHRQGDGVWTELRGGRAQCVRRLEWVASLHAAMAVGAAAHLDIEPSDTRAYDREIFLILHRHARRARVAAAVRTAGRQRHVMALIDVRWDWTVRATAVRRTRPAASTSRSRGGCTFGERRGLSLTLASRGVELLLEPIVLSTQPIPFALHPLKFAPQSLDFAILLGQRVVRIVRTRSIGVLRHAPVMPNLRDKYKGEIKVAPPSEVPTR